MLGALWAVCVPWSAALGGFCSAGGVLGAAAADELLVWFCSVAGGVLGAAAAELVVVEDSLVLGVAFAVAVLFDVLGSGNALALSRGLLAD